jgi:hypothetical protein
MSCLHCHGRNKLLSTVIYTVALAPASRKVVYTGVPSNIDILDSTLCHDTWSGIETRVICMWKDFLSLCATHFSTHMYICK